MSSARPSVPWSILAAVGLAMLPAGCVEVGNLPPADWTGEVVYQWSHEKDLWGKRLKLSNASCPPRSGCVAGDLLHTFEGNGTYRVAHQGSWEFHTSWSACNQHFAAHRFSPTGPVARIELTFMGEDVRVTAEGGRIVVIGGASTLIACY